MRVGLVRTENGTFASANNYVDMNAKIRLCRSCDRWRSFDHFYILAKGIPYSRCKCCLIKERGKEQVVWQISGFSWCASCRNLKPCNDFRQYQNHGSPKQSKFCAQCLRNKSRKNSRDEVIRERSKGSTKYAKMSFRAKRNGILRRYGLKQEDFERMLEQQNGLCYICKSPNKTKYAFHVDHNHTTGKVRKLLCQRCNNGLRYVEENHFLVKALQYLAEHSDIKEQA